MGNKLSKADAAFDGAKSAPVDAGIIARVKQGLSYVIRGVAPDAWMTPSQPLAPVSQESAGRAFDYPVGYNLNVQPRTYEAVGFEQMRALADGYDLLRIVVETRKDQLVKMPWRIRVKDQAKKKDKKATEAAQPRIDAAMTFFELPDREHSWDAWLRMILEDMLVIDAATVYPRLTRGGALYGFEVMDGATITRKINSDGRTPIPPDPAYQQYIKGVPMADYTRDDLVYYPRNPRSHKVYGYSPVEQIIMTVNIALRRQLFQLNYYTEGNVPEALAGVPESWTAEQLREFQAWWDELMEGNLAQRRHMKFVPGGVEFKETKEAILKDEYDEWLARIVCYCFSVSPQAFVKEMNRATAETAQDTALQEGLIPLQMWVRSLINLLLWKYLAYTDLEFAWEEEESISPVEQVQITDTKIRNGSMTIDEAREMDGKDPYPNGLGAKPLVYTASGPVLLENVLNPPTEPEPEPVPGGDGNSPKGDEISGAEKTAKETEEVDAKRQNTPGQGGGGKIEKAAGSRRPKVKPIDRNRKMIKTSRKKIAALFQTAFEKAKDAVKALDFGLAKTDEDLEEKVRKVLAEVDFKGWSIINEDDVEEILAEVTKDGTIEALLQVGMSEEKLTETMSAKAVQYAEERAAALVTEIEESTRDMLRSDVARAMEEGWSNDKLAEELEKNYAFSESRAETIARTETAMADVEGNMTAYKESGVVEGKEWITGSEADCDLCAMNEAKGVLPLDDVFPSGDEAPPAHPNCVCDILPVLTEQGEEE